MRILAGDIGGTHARLATFRTEGGKLRRIRKRTWRSADYETPLPILREYLDDEEEPPDRACLGLAGPVEEGTSRLPNLGWKVRREELAAATGIPWLRLINDFRAVGRGVLLLEEEQLATLQEGGTEPGAPVALIGAGTGLGIGYLAATRSPPRVYASEGGHADFAPRNETEWCLTRFLIKRYGRASCERVLSGEGLVDIYRYLRGRELSRAASGGGTGTDAEDPAAAISRRGLAGDDPLAERALEIFVSAYGALAGNVALTVGARGGVFVAGGIAPKILEALRSGPFLESFRSKGRMRGYMENISVRVVLDEDVGLLGAAAAAFGVS